MIIVIIIMKTTGEKLEKTGSKLIKKYAIYDA